MIKWMVVLLLLAVAVSPVCRAEVRENPAYVASVAIRETKGCSTFEQKVKALQTFCQDTIKPKEPPDTGILPHMVMSIADRIDCGVGWCNHACDVFLDLCERLGIRAREVYLLNDEQTSSPHTVAEAFDSDRGVWVVVDCAYDLDLIRRDGSMATVADLRKYPDILLSQEYVQFRKTLYDTIEEWEAWVRIFTNQGMIVKYNGA